MNSKSNRKAGSDRATRLVRTAARARASSGLPLVNLRHAMLPRREEAKAETKSRIQKMRNPAKIHCMVQRAGWVKTVEYAEDDEEDGAGASESPATNPA